MARSGVAEHCATYLASSSIGRFHKGPNILHDTYVNQSGL
jgi:hypothetical protein